MFGSYRYLLALLTVFAHFDPIYYGRLNWVGTYGVFGFYVLSGYLMTRSLDETYGFSRDGIGRFLWNRALRIYPSYWLAAIVSLLVLMAVPKTVGLYTREIVALPNDARAVLQNVFIFGMHDEYRPRVVSPAWSLNVELCFYVSMALGLSRSRRTVALWLVASLAYTAYSIAAGFSFSDRYSTIAAASLPFSVGAAIHMLVPRGTGHAYLALPVLGVFLVADFLAPALFPDVLLHGFYAALVLTAVIVFFLTRVERSAVPARFAAVDRWLGDLTYPMFLLHFPASFALTAVMSPGARLPSTTLLLLGLPLVHLMALLVVLLVERTVQPSRQRVRMRATSGGAAPALRHPAPMWEEGAPIGAVPRA